MFPSAGMPRVAHWLAELLPLTHFVRLIRGVMSAGYIPIDADSRVQAEPRAGSRFTHRLVSSAVCASEPTAG